MLATLLSRRPRLLVVALLASALTILGGVTPPSAQATTTPLLEFQRDSARASWVSGPGGNYFGIWACPQGSLAVGVRGTESSGYVYAFGLVCRSVNLDTGTWGAYVYTATTHANPTTQLLCPSGQALVRVDVRTMGTYGYPIASETEPYCQTLDFGDVTAVPRQIPTLRGSITAAPSRFFGAAHGSRYGSAICGAGKFIVAIDGRRGALLDGLGIYCGGFTARAATISGVSLSGSTQYGLPVTATPTATGGPTPTMTYQWYRCRTADPTPDATVPAAPECELITGATSASYTPQITDTGSHLRVAATATNYFGSATLVSATTPAPSVPAPSLDLAAASDSGTSATDNHTNDATPTIHLGQLVPTATVEITATSGSTTVSCTPLTALGIPNDETGAPATGQCDLPTLTDGTWTVTTRQTYTPGGGAPITSSTTSLPIVIDTVPPVIGPITLKYGTTTIADGDAQAVPVANSFTLTAPTATDAHTGVTITCALDSGAFVACPTSYTNLTAGEHRITVRAVDKAGNTSTRTHTWTVVTPVVIDLTADSDSGIANTDNITNDTTPTFQVSQLVDGATVTLTAVRAGQPNRTCVFVADLVSSPRVDSCTFSASPSAMVDGTWTVTATQTVTPSGRAATSTVSNTQSLHLDTVAPAFNALSGYSTGVGTFANGATVLGHSTWDYTLTGTFTDAAGYEQGGTCSVDGGAVRQLTAGVESCQLLDATSGVHQVVFTRFDKAGNQSAPQTITWTVVNYPTLALAGASDTGTSSTDRITADSTPTMQVGDLAPGATVTVTATRTGSASVTCTFTAPAAVAPATASSGGCDLGTLADGSWSITATQALGSTSRTSSITAITVDTARPTPTAPVIRAATSSGTIIANDGATTATTAWIGAVTAVAGTTMQCRLDGAVVACPTTNTAYPNLAVGSHTFEVISTDAAGNVGIAQTTWRVLGKPVVALDPASDTGVSSSDRITRDSTPQITVSSLSGAGGTVTVTATRAGASTISCTFVATSTSGGCSLPTAIDGTWTVTAQESLRVGASTVTSAVSDAIAVVIDTVAPVAPSVGLTVGGSAISAGGVVQLGAGVTSGTVTYASPPSSEAGATISCSLDGAAAASCPAGGLGTIANGVHALTMTAVDLAGNTAQSVVQWAQVEQVVLGLDPSGNLATTASGQLLTSSRTQSVTLSGLSAVPVVVTATSGARQVTCTITDVNSPTCTLDFGADSDGTWTLSADQGVSIPASSSTLIVDTTQPSLSVSITEPGTSALVAGTAGSTVDYTTSRTALSLAVAATDAIDTAVATTCALDGGTSGACPSSIGPLTYGEHTLVVTATDDAGNVRTSTMTWFVAAAPTVALATASDSGVSSSDGITRDATPTITVGGLGRDVDVVVTASKAGQADVTCYLWHANESGSVPGSASCDLGSLVDGTWSISATQTVSGRPEWRSPASVPALVVVDTVAPTAPSSTFANGIAPGSVTTQTSLAFTSGPTSTDANPVTYTCSLNDATPTSCGALSALSPGTYALRTIATDAAGNASSSSLSWTIIGPPVVGLSADSNSGSLSDTITNVSSPVMSLTGLIPGASVTVTATRGSESVSCTFIAPAPVAGSASSTGGCQLPGLTSDGAWTVAATQAIGGTTSTASSSVTLTLDTQAPVQSTGISAVAGGSAVPNGGGTELTSISFTLLGAEAGTTRTCTLDGAAITCPSAPLTGLANGVHTLTVTDTDVAGNATTASFVWAVVGVPTVALAAEDDSSAADRVTNIATPSFAVGALTSGATVEVIATKGSDTLACSFVVADGITSCEMPPMSDGAWTVKARQGFGSGWSAYSSTTTVTIDTTAPSGLGASLTAGTTTLAFAAGDETAAASTTIALSGLTSTDVHAVTYTCSLNGASSAPCASSYAGLSSGVTRLAITATDLAGNTTTLSRTWSVIAPPVIALHASSDTGASGDGVTAEQSPMFDVSNLMPGATVTVTAQRAGSPTSTCTFTAPAASVPGAASAGSCSLGTSIAGLGWSITATQEYRTSTADPADAVTVTSATSNAVLLDVVQPHEVVIDAPTSVRVSEQVITLQARSVPMSFLSVTLTSLTPSICAIDANGDITLLAPGTCTLHGTAPGGDDGSGTYYDAGLRTVSFAVVAEEVSTSVPAGRIIDSVTGATPAVPGTDRPVRAPGVGSGGENGASATTGLRPPPGATSLRIEPLAGSRGRVVVTVRQDVPGAPVRSVVFLVFDETGRKVRQVAVDVAEGQTVVETVVPYANSEHQVRTFTTNEAGVSARAPIGANVLNQPTTLGRRDDGTPIMFGTRIARPVLFDPDSPALDARARRTLDGVVRYAAKNGGRVFITGFVRNQGGSRKDQRELSRSRAAQVAAYLSRRGVDTWIRYDGYGPYRSGPGRPEDRRVEVRWSDEEIPGLRAVRVKAPIWPGGNGA